MSRYGLVHILRYCHQVPPCQVCANHICKQNAWGVMLVESFWVSHCSSPNARTLQELCWVLGLMSVSMPSADAWLCGSLCYICLQPSSLVMSAQLGHHSPSVHADNAQPTSSFLLGPCSTLIMLGQHIARRLSLPACDAVLLIWSC